MLVGSSQLLRAASKLQSSKVLASLGPSQSLLVTKSTNQAHLEQRGLSHLHGKPTLALTPLQSQLQQLRSSSGGSHAGMFKLERYWAVGMLPLFPAAYFIHEPWMDYALAISISLHLHWGLHVVMEDYARPILLGKTFSKIAVNSVYLISILIFAGLLSFNYNDVGITKAFEMVWTL